MGFVIGYVVQERLRKRLIRRFKNLLADYYTLSKENSKLKNNLKSKK